MSKKKKVILTIAILSCITLAFLGGHSYSKYVSEIKGIGTAEIATWNFKVNGVKEEIQTINLHSTANSNTLNENQIAPGTEGSFDIIVDGSGSEVGISYNIKFVDGNEKPKNLKFIYNDREYNNITELNDILSGTINANDANKTKLFTIKWKWLYETGSGPEEIASNDKIDTQNAQSITNYTFNVVVSGTQVEPQV